MNVLSGQTITKSLIRLFKESIFVTERCAFQTSAVHNRYKKFSKTHRWVPELILQEEITDDPLKPLKTHKTGGRGPDGRVWNRRRAGGDPRLFRVVDTHRSDLGNGEPRIERVLWIMEDPNRSAHIAAVAGGNRKRYILATENMQPGDLITTSCVLTDIPVKPKEGDSYPVGSLPTNTIVHNVEKVPGDGGSIAKAAGSSATITRHVGNQSVIKMPSKVEVQVPNTCMASVGKVSNILHGETPWDNINEKRRAGIKQRSGRYVKKGSVKKMDAP